MKTPILVRMWIYEPARPGRPIKEVLVPLLHCEKTAWALMSKGKRKLIGSSAFFTFASCRRAKLGAIEEKINKFTWMSRKYPGAYSYYKKIAEAMKANPKVDPVVSGYPPRVH